MTCSRQTSPLCDDGCSNELNLIISWVHWASLIMLGATINRMEMSYKRVNETETHGVSPKINPSCLSTALVAEAKIQRMYFTSDIGVHNPQQFLLLLQESFVLFDRQASSHLLQLSLS